MSVPDGLHERGTALWEALGVPLDSAPGAIALEACRAVDRLEDLNSVIAGKGVLELLNFRLNLDLDDPAGTVAVVKVEFSNVLAEARQQAANLKNLLASIDAPAAPAKPTEGANPLAALKLALVQPAT